MNGRGVEKYTEDGYQWHYWTQVVHERVVDDPEYLQRAILSILTAADRDLDERDLTRIGSGINGRHVEVIVRTRCEG